MSVTVPQLFVSLKTFSSHMSDSLPKIVSVASNSLLLLPFFCSKAGSIPSKIDMTMIYRPIVPFVVLTSVSDYWESNLNLLFLLSSADSPCS